MNFNKQRYDEWLAKEQAACYKQLTETKQMSEYREPNYAAWGTVWVFLGLVLIGGLITIGMFGCPTYNVYSSGMNGKAMLAHANYSKEVAVAEAKARKESALFDKEATIIKAEAVAKANEIIGDSLKNNEDYLKYLWITETLGQNADKQIIYVPTEGNVPVMEAGRSVRHQP